MMRSRMILQEHVLEILYAYTTDGAQAGYAIGKRYGVSESYVRKLAFSHKVRARMPSGPRWRPNCMPENDPRWKRALAIGEVVV